jgi:hypothetical protein
MSRQPRASLGPSMAFGRSLHVEMFTATPPASPTGRTRSHEDLQEAIVVIGPAACEELGRSARVRVDPTAVQPGPHGRQMRCAFRTQTPSRAGELATQGALFETGAACCWITRRVAGAHHLSPTRASGSKIQLWGGEGS